jgi:hypothetical protein
MLTKGDDFPIHQTPEPVAYAGTDRNFYDRYFFNGYDPAGELYFAAALGVYPLLNVMDAALSVVHQGVQYSVRASKVLGMERMDTQVGPISVEVVRPLERLRVRVGPNDFALQADLTFVARSCPIEEPRFHWQVGPRTLLDYTRLTQFGVYEGWVEVAGDRIPLSPERFRGTRDRSWGIRPVGEREPMGGVQIAPQFFWLWAPLNFDDCMLLFDTNETADGNAWHQSAVITREGDAAPEPLSDVRYKLDLRSGTRHARQFELSARDPSGAQHRVELEPVFPFFMTGIGYTHPEWSHGTYHGDLAVDGERFATKDVDVCVPQFIHIQEFCRARMGNRTGSGILEQLIIGPHEPTGLKEIFDMAP